MNRRPKINFSSKSSSSSEQKLFAEHQKKKTKQSNMSKNENKIIIEESQNVKNQDSENINNQNNQTPNAELESTGIKRISTRTAHLIKNRQKNMENLKMFRPNFSRNKRKKILKIYPMLKRIACCNSKTELIKIFTNLSARWKKLVKKYMERCFLIHLHLRQIKNFSELMQQRQNIYDALDDPSILENGVNFANNLVKNFCKGITNFVVMFYDELKEYQLLEKRKLRLKVFEKSSSDSIDSKQT